MEFIKNAEKLKLLIIAGEIQFNLYLSLYMQFIKNLSVSSLDIVRV